MRLVVEKHGRLNEALELLLLVAKSELSEGKNVKTCLRVDQQRL